MVSTLRRLGVALCVPLVLALTGCMAQFQTLQPYTPGQGVNHDIGSVKIRNLLVIADNSGQGVISASMVSASDDSLTAVAGTPLSPSGAPGSALVVTATGIPLAMTPNTLVVLTEGPTRLAVSSPDLKPGLLAQVTLTFSKAGQITLVAPVVSSSEPQFGGIKIG